MSQSFISTQVSIAASENKTKHLTQCPRAKLVRCIKLLCYKKVLLYRSKSGLASVSICSIYPIPCSVMIFEEVEL